MDRSTFLETDPVYDYISEVNEAFRVDHPQKLKEGLCLAYQNLPYCDYKPKIFEKIPELLTNKIISTPQTEFLIHAIQRFNQPLVDGYRPGVYNGDQTGVGKTRIYVSVAAELLITKGISNKSVVVSASNHLFQDVKRELELVQYPQKVVCLKDCKKLKMKKGLVFTSYSTLTSMSGKWSKMLKEWLGSKIFKNTENRTKAWNISNFDGLIVFDESHLAKNPTTKIGKLVEELQMLFPLARILYCSATAGTIPDHLYYMTRLNLWGRGTGFKNFENFVAALGANDVLSGMELISVDLKRRGAFVCRQISLEGVEFRVVDCDLDEIQTAQYSMSVLLWQMIYTYIRALDLTNREKKKLWSQYWADHQRYFDVLLTGFKVKTVLKLRAEYPEEKYNFVVSLQNTGENGLIKGSKSDNQSKEYSMGGSILKNCLTRLEVFETLRESQGVQVEALQQSLSGSNESNTIMEIRRTIVEQFEQIEKNEQFDRNPIDELIDALGGPANVSELTGRVCRQVRTSDDSFEIVRSGKEVSTELEVAKFMSGEKKNAIISTKGSTGLSLHDDRNNAYSAQRVQVCIQFPWNAETSMQQFGRTNRSNQRTAPIFILIKSNVPGEMRFYSSFLDKIRKMGAVCQGHRQASPFKFDLECPFSSYEKIAAKAAMATITDIAKDSSSEIRDSIIKVGLCDDVESKPVPKPLYKIFNRIIGISIQHQYDFVQKLKENYQHMLMKAKEKGLLDEGPKSISSSWALTWLSKSPELGSENGPIINTFIADRGYSWFMATRVIEMMANKLVPKQPVIFSKDNEIYLCFQQNEGTSYRAITPWNCHFETVASDYLGDWNQITDFSIAERIWTNIYKLGEKGKCIHWLRKEPCTTPFCIFEARRFKVHLVCENILLIYQELADVFRKNQLNMQTLNIVAKKKVSDKQFVDIKFVGVFIEDSICNQISNIVKAAHDKLLESSESEEEDSDDEEEEFDEQVTEINSEQETVEFSEESVDGNSTDNSSKFNLKRKKESSPNQKPVKKIKFGKKNDSSKHEEDLESGQSSESEESSSDTDESSSESDESSSDDDESSSDSRGSSSSSDSN